MKLKDYLDRIGFDGPVYADVATLTKIHRAHVLATPYENLDVQLGAPVSRAPNSIYEKIVLRRRGGWCYEMNGIFSWALEEIGFTVERLAGAVERAVFGDGSVGNHLVLIVTADDQPWLADVGFGDGLIEPIRLKAGAFSNGFLNCSLTDLGSGWWRYDNDPRGSAESFDFNRNVRDAALLEKNNHQLQTDKDSIFMLNAVVQRWTANEHLSLRGRVFTRLSANQVDTRLIENAVAYVAVLKRHFDLDLPEAATLWDKICARHEDVFALPAMLKD